MKALIVYILLIIIDIMADISTISSDTHVTDAAPAVFDADDEWEEAPVQVATQCVASVQPPREIKYIEPPAATTVADLPPESVACFADASKLWIGRHDGMTRVGPFPADVNMRAIVASFPFRGSEATRALLKKMPFLTYESRWGYNWMLLDLGVKTKNDMKQTEEEIERGDKPQKPDGFVLYETLNEWAATLGRTPVFCGY